MKNRQALLDKSWRSRLFAYVSKTLSQRGHYALAVNGHFDHIHLFFDYSCKELIADLVREIKKSSSKFVKENQLSKYKFEWQSGYGVFSNGYRERDMIIKYILNQEINHTTRSFKEEYMSLLKNYEIAYKNEYVFRFFEDLY